jgi:hypothetical protein
MGGKDNDNNRYKVSMGPFLTGHTEGGRDNKKPLDLSCRSRGIKGLLWDMNRNGYYITFPFGAIVACHG